MAGLKGLVATLFLVKSLGHFCRIKLVHFFCNDNGEMKKAGNLYATSQWALDNPNTGNIFSSEFTSENEIFFFHRLGFKTFSLIVIT